MLPWFSSWHLEGCLLIVLIWQRKRGRKLSGVSSFKGTNLFMRPLPWPYVNLIISQRPHLQISHRCHLLLPPTPAQVLVTRIFFKVSFILFIAKICLPLIYLLQKLIGHLKFYLEKQRTKKSLNNLEKEQSWWTTITWLQDWCDLWFFQWSRMDVRVGL